MNRIWPETVVLHSGRTVTMADVRDYCRFRSGEFIGQDGGNPKRFGMQTGVRMRYSVSLESVEFWKDTGRL